MITEITGLVIRKQLFNLNLLIMGVSEKVLNAAINGPEAKSTKISELGGGKKHKFNVKPVTISRNKNGDLFVFGQISHDLRFRTDDQHWFAFKKKGGTIAPSDPAKMIVKKEDGGFVKTLTGPLRPIGRAIGLYFGVDVDKYYDTLDSHADKLSFVDLDDGYEKAIENYLNALTRNFKFPSIPRVGIGLTLFEHHMFRGKQRLIETNKNVSNLNTVGFNDIASSLVAIVPDNLKLEVFRDGNFSGNKLEFGTGTHIIRDLKIHDLGDKITSVKWSIETTQIPLNFNATTTLIQAM